MSKDVPGVEWRLYRARLTLDGKSVVGSGRTKKAAKSAAARKYINSNFHGHFDAKFLYSLTVNGLTLTIN